MGQVRITGGIHRSRIIKFTAQNELRPTLDAIRETLFNWLMQDLSGYTCLDLFGGTGILSFEALSRGADEIDLVEKNPQIVKDLKHNKSLLKATNLNIIWGSAISYIRTVEKQYDLILIDPPFDNPELLVECLEIIKSRPNSLLKKHGLIYIEYSEYSEIDLDQLGYDIIKSKKTGNVHYALLEL